MAERVIVCAMCGAEFVATAPCSKYCSFDCQRIARRQATNKWYNTHRDEILAKRRQWWADNTERAHEWARRYYYGHREACLERMKKWRDANKDERNARKRVARAAYYAKHGYPVRTCRRCGLGFKPLYSAQRMCEACMTKRSPTWRRKLKFLIPQQLAESSPVQTAEVAVHVTTKQLVPDERGMLYCPRLRLKSTELPCGQLDTCFGRTACDYLPEGAVRPKGTLI